MTAYAGNIIYASDINDLAPGPWIGFTYSGTWANNGGGFATLNYRLNNGMVEIMGVAKSPNPFSSAMGTMPSGYRPSSTQVVFATINTAGTDCFLTVSSAGAVTTFGNTGINTPWFVSGFFAVAL